MVWNLRTGAVNGYGFGVMVGRVNGVLAGLKELGFSLASMFQSATNSSFME